MMKTLIKLNTKIMHKSPVYWLICGFITFFFFVFVYLVYPSSINFAATLGEVAYIEITMIILIFSMAVYFSHEKYSIEDICQVPHNYSVISRLISQILVSSILLLLPLTFIIYAAFAEHTSLLFTIEVSINVISRWLYILLISSSFGFLIGLLLKRHYAYLIAIPFCIVFSYLNSYLFSYFFPINSRELLILTNLLSIQDPFMTSVKLDYVSSLIDIFWLVKKLFLASLVGIFVFVVIILTSYGKQKRLRFYISGMALIFLLAGSCIAYIEFFPNNYNYYEKLYITSTDNTPYSITSYSGEINLSENMTVSCSITVSRNNANTEKMQLRLDKSFEIEQIYFNDQAIPFERDGDYLIISDDNLPQDNTFTLFFNYHGRVYYISDIDGINIFSSYRATALPSSFAFLPMINGDDVLKSYSLDVCGGNTIISNVLPQKVDGNVYHIDGISDTLCLFMGYLKSVSIGDTTVFRASFNKLTDYEKVYNSAFAYPYFDPYTVELIEHTFKTRPVAFLIYDLYDILGFPVVYQDYWIMNYGFPV